MKRTLIKNVTVVNEGSISLQDVLIENDVISRIAAANSVSISESETMDGTNLFLLPGLIDDQVHFREPGLTHKGELLTESIAAVAGGITSYMEMPNTVPAATNKIELEKKYTRAAEVSLANFSFYIGASNNNLSELTAIDPRNVCGVKVFMGSSTGDLVVDDRDALEGIFREVKTIITTHCEDDPEIRKNAENYRAQYGEDVPMSMHPLIRSREACVLSSSLARTLAEKYGSKLHILHISTKDEADSFGNDIPLEHKHITAEACVHHLWFCDQDYESKGTWIKWNPAIKTAADRDAILRAVIEDRIDVIATDHAPHTRDEKMSSYFKAPSGGPLVQHALQALIELHLQGKISLEKIVEKTSHNVAKLFEIEKRGFIREGYFADLVLVDLQKPQTVNKENILYKCGWSPFEGFTFSSTIRATWVNGHLAFHDGTIDHSRKGSRLTFNRK
jgi:dihydroorotase